MTEDEKVISFGITNFVIKIVTNDIFHSACLIESSSELHPIAEILDNLKNVDLALSLGSMKRLNGEVNCLV